MGASRLVTEALTAVCVHGHGEEGTHTKSQGVGLRSTNVHASWSVCADADTRLLADVLGRWRISFRLFSAPKFHNVPQAA